MCIRDSYKDLEKGKWVKLEGWGGRDEARQILRDAMERYAQTEDTARPKF